MKQVYLWPALAALVVLTGCSSQDFGRPIAQIGDVVDSGKAYVEDSTDEEAVRRASQFAEILAEWERQKVTVDEDYTLGPDDVVTIGILSLETPDEVSELERTISKDGTVSLPLVGAVSCSGLTAREFQNRVTEAYRGNYLQDPQVDVAVVEYRSAPVVVTGAVTKPGVYYLRHNRSSVLEVLSMANGLSDAAGDNLLIVRRLNQTEKPKTAEAAEEADSAVAVPEPWTGSHIADRVAAMEAEEVVEQTMKGSSAEEADAAATDNPDAPMIAQDGDTLPPSSLEEAVENDLNTDLITVDLERLLDQGDVRLNVPIMGGDIVTVPPGRQAYVYVLGYVQRPGAFELKKRKRVRALQAVAMAGGLSGAARAQNSFLVIDNPTGRKVVSIDLTKIARGQRPPVYMESGYTLVIGSSVMARLSEFIRPTVSAGANLTPGP